MSVKRTVRGSVSGVLRPSVSQDLRCLATSAPWCPHSCLCGDMWGDAGKGHQLHVGYFLSVQAFLSDSSNMATFKCCAACSSSAMRARMTRASVPSFDAEVSERRTNAVDLRGRDEVSCFDQRFLSGLYQRVGVQPSFDQLPSADVLGCEFE